MSETTGTSGMQQQVTRIVAKAWADDGFKQRLLSDPNGTVQAEGVAVPPGVKLVVHEDDGTPPPPNTADTLHFVLPGRPADSLSDEDLDSIAGGVMQYTSTGMPMLTSPGAPPAGVGAPRGITMDT